MDLPIVVVIRCHSLFSHICRLVQEAPAHRALELAINITGGTRPSTDWKRPRGHPRWTWLQQLEEDLATCLFSVAQDQSVWTSL